MKNFPFFFQCISLSALHQAYPVRQQLVRQQREMLRHRYLLQRLLPIGGSTVVTLPTQFDKEPKFYGILM
jgi:hypothetical protein